MGKIGDILHRRDKLRELFLYVVFGVLTTAVNWGVYTLLTLAFGLKNLAVNSTAYWAVTNGANLTAWVLSVLFAYLTNRRFVFQSKTDRHSGAWREFWLFVSARVMSYLLFDLALFNLCLAVLPDFTLVLTRDQMIKLLMNVLVVIFNYVSSKWVVFRGKKEKM